MRDTDQTGPRGAASPKRVTSINAAVGGPRPSRSAHPEGSAARVGWAGRAGCRAPAVGDHPGHDARRFRLASAGPPALSTLWTTGCGYPHCITGGCWDAGMNASGATPSTATVFDALLSTGLSAADADSELCSGSVTISGRLVTDPYTPVGRTDRVWLRNELARSVMPPGGTLRLPGHQRAVPVPRWSRRRQYRCR